MYLIKNNNISIIVHAIRVQAILVQANISNKLIISSNKLIVSSNKLSMISSELCILVHAILVQAIIVQAIISNKLSIIKNKLSSIILLLRESIKQHPSRFS